MSVAGISSNLLQAVSRLTRKSFSMLATLLQNRINLGTTDGNGASLPEIVLNLTSGGSLPSPAFKSTLSRDRRSKFTRRAERTDPRPTPTTCAGNLPAVTYNRNYSHLALAKILAQSYLWPHRIGGSVCLSYEYLQTCERDRLDATSHRS